MITFNKYLKELSVSENDFFFQHVDERYYPDDDTGIPESHTWEMDKCLEMIIYTHLRKFKDCNQCCHPACVTEEKWNKILNDMIKGFASIIKNEISHNATKRKKRALSLFNQYFFCLWW